MPSEFTKLEENDQESGRPSKQDGKKNSDPGSISRRITLVSEPPVVTGTHGSRRISTMAQVQAINAQAGKRRTSVAARVGSAIVRGITSTNTPKMGISAAKEREIAAEWEQFENEKRNSKTTVRPSRKAQTRPPKANKLNRRKPETSSEDTLAPLPSYGSRSQMQGNANKSCSQARHSFGGMPLKGGTADATDLNILWRVQARKAEGKKTTPEQMAKLRLMLKSENTGSRRSRNSVYSIDPSLLERPGRIREINSMEEFKERLDQAKEALVCVTFSAKWCGPWRMIKPDVHRLSHIHGDVEFYEIDVDDNEEIAEARRVACMPTFQFFKRGIMLDKFAEPNRIKLDETIRKLRKMEIRPEE